MLLQSFWNHIRRGYCSVSGFMKMSNLNVKAFDGNSQFQLSFQFEDPNSRFLRVFNFTRPVTEKCEETSEKISHSIVKTLTKYYKKQKVKFNEESLNIAVNFLCPSSNKEATTLEILKHPDCKLQVLEQEYGIEWNTPVVTSLKMPKSVMVGFPCYPMVEMDFGDEIHSMFRWFRSKTTNTIEQEKVDTYLRQWLDKGKKPPKPMKVSPPDELDPSQWTFLSETFFYLPKEEDIDHWLLCECVPKDGVKIGSPARAVAPTIVSPGPGPCPFEVRHQFTKERSPESGFRIVTYNLLADLYADSNFSREVLFPYCPPYAIELSYRKQLFLKEITGYNADIMCFQEVDSKVFDMDLKPFLGVQGFTGIFDKKGGQVTEGLSCFYRNDRFRFIDTKSVILGEELPTLPIFQKIWEAVQRNPALKDRVIQRSTAIQGTVLESVLFPNRWIVVGNTHLYFHPDADHIRLLQAGMGIYYLENLLKSLKEKNPDKEISLLFCGDFNSSPSNAVLELMRYQHIPSDHQDWSSNVDEAVENLLLVNPIKMDSACGVPKYTNYTEGFKDTLDYIFYEVGKFDVTQVVPLPSDDELAAHTALPSVVFPSDHVALIADLRWSSC